MTLSDVDALDRTLGERDAVFHMDEDAFRLFYDRTARSLTAYLARLTGDRQVAADLMQEAYYRFLRAAQAFESDAHRRNYLFRIATNLVRDRRRRPFQDHVSIDEEGAIELASDAGTADQVQRRRDLTRAMAHLRQRDRELLWLAYAHGSTHEEIAAMLGLKTASIKLLLFRARHRLADLIRRRDAMPQEQGR